ncbi:hypothetical protein GUJ93_ZPchr0009g533 [Zizania palustris]|uniref:Uncharacterized protein n=1 Tax=Zizania palustris TaxID=103762 RepID=A0A8J5RPB8_ZIZPA|nr:hypothetical protein GUJ93_ZPchr0009g533 [Zizania palustris]KAG8049176.1 hypothetical protein GUJ93_ZPchr0009g533 [Zizania palustris]KAG8049177.1 hypothetical protein GUJ93_ZPchr0009g533 [Zizania palustris]KAG8049178.1 hypothetical protein GUJ93_ZPchr0009g533 [Zizania palustris]
MSQFAAAMKSPVPVAAAAAADGKSPLFCPKPRRPVAPLRCHQSSHSDAGMDLLDLLLSKGEESNLAAASPQPPLFCGSPPRRASNPVVHDSRFGLDCPPMPAWPVVVAAAAAAAPVVVRPTPRPAAPPMSPRGGAGCARARFTFQPAAVRVEGFDCLDRGRGGRGHGITAMA